MRDWEKLRRYNLAQIQDGGSTDIKQQQKKGDTKDTQTPPVSGAAPAGSVIPPIPTGSVNGDSFPPPVDATTSPITAIATGETAEETTKEDTTPV